MAADVEPISYRVLCGDEAELGPDPILQMPSGQFTLVGPSGHRTFSVERQAPDAPFKPGQRLIYLLVGCDNEHDWKAFGDVADGVVKWPIRVWRRYAEPGSDFLFYAERLTLMICGGFRRFRTPSGDLFDYRLLMARRCFRCDRKLTTPESIASGIGPECRKKG